GRLPAPAEGEHILDLIASAGGPAGPGPEEWVMLERNGRRALAPFGALVDEPANNVYLHATDPLSFYPEPQTFLGLAAVGAQSQLPLGPWGPTWPAAIAGAGGLAVVPADPAAVFLYRGEPREVAQQLGVDVPPFAGPIIPIIYNLNLRDPAGNFLA